MEVEIVNRKKGSRVIQQKGGPGGQAHIADNRANPVQSLMRNRSVAQRVIQRTREADKKFYYVPYSSDINFRVPYTSKTIHFSDFEAGSEIKSAGFSGCYMMAFHFNPTKTEEEIRVLLNTPDNLDSRKIRRTFVAHVASDAREPFFDAVNRELIIVEAIFRPYNQRSKDIVPSPREGPETLSIGQAGNSLLTGGMRQIIDGAGESTWEGEVYTQERIPKDWTGEQDQMRNYSGVMLFENDFDWVNHSVQTMDANQMKLQTQATLAYIYSRICLEDLINNKWAPCKPHPALKKLKEIKRKNALAIETAWDTILIQGEDRHQTSSRTFDSSVIASFLMAVYHDDAEVYLQGLVPQKSSCVIA